MQHLTSELVASGKSLKDDYEREERQAEQEAELRRARRVAEHNEDISLRAAVPPAPLSQRAFLRPIVGQKDILQDAMGGLTAAEKQRGEDRRIRQRMEAEEEAMRQRLRDRQVSTRRFSTGPGSRRHRVLYDDGVYRWVDNVSTAMAVVPRILLPLKIIAEAELLFRTICKKKFLIPSFR